MTRRRTFGSGVLLVAGLLLAAGGSDAAFAQKDPRYEVRLVDRSVIPDAKIEKKRYGVLQFYDVPTEAQHRALVTLGVLLADFIPNLAYTASVPNSVKKKDLQGLNVRAYFALKWNDKLDPELARGGIPPWALGEDGRARLLVSVFPGLRAGEAEAALRRAGAAVLAYSELLGSLTVQVAPNRVRNIAALALVRFVQPVPPPAEPANDLARSIIGTSDLQPTPWGTASLLDGLTGTGVRLGIWDLGPSISHTDLSGRVTVVEPPPVCWTFPHPTLVAGNMAGDGVSSSVTPNVGTAFQWAGMAPKADVFQWSAANSSCNADADYEMGPAVTQYQIVLANNSWGLTVPICAFFGDYNYSITYDEIVRTQNLGLVFSAGNWRNTNKEAFCEAAGSLPGGGYRTVVPPATGKNVITVGAIDKSSTSQMYVDGSWGPTSDGRLKPDVVAVGVNVKSTVPPDGYLTASGTSFAAPGVTGTAALLVERYRQLNGGQNPKQALTKAILLNTADDLGTAGPDFQFGYGRVNAPAADRTLKDGRHFVDSVAHGGTKSFSLTVPPPPINSSCTIKVMLAYTDQEGVSWIATKLVNDLDLYLVDPSGTGSGTGPYLPLTLDPLNPSAAAVAAPNHLDNVEQVVVNNAPAGVWTAVVSGFFVPWSPQEFALTWGGTCFDQWPLYTVTNTNTLVSIQAPSCTTTPIGVTKDAISPFTVRRIRGLAYDDVHNIMYGMTREGDLVTVDRGDGTTTFLFAVNPNGAPPNFWGGLAFDGTDKLYTTNAFGANELVEIVLSNPTTVSSATVVGSTTFGGIPLQILGLEFSGGVLYGSNRTNDNIVVVDAGTGAVTMPFGNQTVGVNNLQEIAIHPQTGDLYAIHDHSSSSDDAALSIYNVTTQMSTELCAQQLSFGIVETLGGGNDTYGWGGLTFAPKP